MGADGQETRREVRPFLYIQADERANGVTDDWYFENVDTHDLLPTDDWEVAISRHAKIMLDSRHVYHIHATIKIRGACYIVGNGAKVVVHLTEGAAFQVVGGVQIPCIGHMERVCFTGVLFERSHAENRAIVISAETPVVVHGCTFLGAHSLCVGLRSGGVIRGCHFMANVCAVHTHAPFRVGIKNCVFEKCFFGALIQCRAVVRGCMFVDCVNSMTLGGIGQISVTQCSFVVTNRAAPPFGVRLCTCVQGSHVVPLGNIHVCPSRVGYPRFERNTLSRIRMYLGRRRGLFHPKYCMFALSVVCSFRDVTNRLTMHGVFENTMAIMQTVRLDGSNMEDRLCTCGVRHPTPLMVNVNVSAEVKLDRELVSVDTAEFSSTDDDSD